MKISDFKKVGRKTWKLHELNISLLFIDKFYQSRALSQPYKEIFCRISILYIYAICVSCGLCVEYFPTHRVWVIKICRYGLERLACYPTQANKHLMQLINFTLISINSSWIANMESSSLVQFVFQIVSGYILSCFPFSLNYLPLLIGGALTASAMSLCVASDSPALSVSSGRPASTASDRCPPIVLSAKPLCVATAFYWAMKCIQNWADCPVSLNFNQQLWWWISVEESVVHLLIGTLNVLLLYLGE